MERIIFRVLKPRCRNPLVVKRKFHEPYRSSYPMIYDRKPESPKNLTLLQQLRNSYDLLKSETKLFIEELKPGFHLLPKDFVVDEIDTVWKFDGTQQSLDQWIVNCDKDYHHGYSTAKLELSSFGTGIFHGMLDTRLPKDGKTTHAGYCNITSIEKFKSFGRRHYYNWVNYNELVLRIRGDGRCYMLNILQKGKIDITQYDCHHYVMYTRGGPYWQVVRIPFSKFLFNTKGEIDGNQYPVCHAHITNFGITLADKKPGPFRLEIDYIGLCCNTNIRDEFTYETYDVDRTLK